jgi:ABC-type Zn uptake system ZnuABC Zn-binding protein ZnuA
MTAERVKMIISDPFFESRTPEYIAKQAGAIVAPLAILPGAAPEAKDYIAMVDYNVRTVAKTLSAGQEEHP